MSANAAPSIARASLIIGFGNIASRILGLLREVVLAGIFGPSGPAAAFNNAVVFSRSIFDLLIAGHVSSAIVPVLSEIEANSGRDALWRVVAALAGMIILIISGLMLLIIAAAGPIAAMIGGEAETIDLTAQLIRLTAPALLLMCLFALYSGTLYALRVFTYPALAAAAFNATMIAVTLLQAGRPDAIYGVAAAWIAGAAAQLALQLYGLRTGRLRISFAFRDPLVAPVLKRIGWLYMPVIGSLVIDLATTRFLTYALAAQAAIAFGNTYIQYATTLYQFPQGLIATAISAAILPTLSRAADQADRREYVETFAFGLRMTTTLILPAAVGMAVLAVPIIQLIYQNGAFTAESTGITAIALRLYLIGLPFAAWDLLLVYAFYARQDTATPATIGIFSFVIYTAAALALFPPFGLYALMMADAIKHIAHAAVCAVVLWRRGNWPTGQRLGRTLARTLAATLGMALAAHGLLLVTGIGGGDDTLRELFTVTGGLLVCAVTYTVLALALGLEEFRAALRMITARLRPARKS